MTPHFLAKVPDLGLLAEILGHSEESVTRLYQHMLPERLARARNVVSIGMPGSNGPRERAKLVGCRPSYGSLLQRWDRLPDEVPYLGWPLRSSGSAVSMRQM